MEKDEGGVYIRCINPACPAQLKERLRYFCGRDQMDILVEPRGFDGQPQPAYRHDHRGFPRRDMIDIHLGQIGDQA